MAVEAVASAGSTVPGDKIQSVLAAEDPPQHGEGLFGDRRAFVRWLDCSAILGKPDQNRSAGMRQIDVGYDSAGADFNPWSLATAKSSADFFAGIGLMRMGLEKEGWVVSFENDIDEKKYAMHTHHFGASDGGFVIEDIHNLSPDQVPSVSLATASFPCNDLSLAGSRKGLKGKQSSAFWGFVRILKVMETRRPPLVLLENVAGFLTSHEGKDLTDALLSLNRLNYKIDVFILDAVHFVPQSRKRLFVIGTQTDGTPSKTVSKEAEESALRPKALIHFIRNHPEIDWNIRNLPSPPTAHTRTAGYS